MRVKTDAKTGHDWVMLALLLLNGLMSRQLCCQIGTFIQIAVPQCISTSDAKGTVPGASPVHLVRRENRPPRLL